MYDYLVVGAGFAGAVIAERLASQLDKKVLIIDKRPHIAGNAYDHLDEAGILIHKYGPHIFHTGSARIFKYLSQFTAWRPYEHRVIARIDDKLVPFPINVDTVNILYGTNLNEEEVEALFRERAENIPHPKTSEEAVVSKIGRELYEKFFRGYTRKMWGLDPSELDASVAARVPARTNHDDRYFTDEFQAMPLDGYTKKFERMLAHPNITIQLETDYRDIDPNTYREMIYTGPVDAFFDYCYGKLPYRSIRFEFQTHDTPVFQPGAVVNYPDEHIPHTRITEFKYLTGQEHDKTTVVYEYPTAEGDPYYPVPRPENAELYRKYKELADKTPNVRFVGRLATYRYYNMDQVVGQALATFDQIVKTMPAIDEELMEQRTSNIDLGSADALHAPKKNRESVAA